MDLNEYERQRLETIAALVERIDERTKLMQEEQLRSIRQLHHRVDETREILRRELKDDIVSLREDVREVAQRDAKPVARKMGALTGGTIATILVALWEALKHIKQ